MPKRIGRYTLGKTLGTGNYARVRQAFETDHPENEYAIKIIDKDQLAAANLEEQLRREIAILKCLRHPNVVRMREVMQTSNTIYLVLELVTGGELYEQIQAARRLSEDVARKYFQQLIVGVRYCHQQGIAHRDLKPENLLLDGMGNLKISDFGLSNLQRGGTNPTQGAMMQTLCGTAHYVAPEVLSERGYNGQLSDVWSCGVILFVMLAGYLPFDDPNLNALFNKIERGDFRMDRCFSASAADLIARILTVDPMKRYTLDQVIAHPWFQVGFDPVLLENQMVQVTPDEIRNAFTTAVEEPEDQASSEGAGRADPNAGPDAFELIRWSLAGSFLPITIEKSYFPMTTLRDHRRVFLYGAPQGVAAQELHAVLKAMKTNPRPHRDSPNEIKGFFNAAGGLMTYVAVVEKTIVPTLSIVDIRRGRGRVDEFHAFVTQVEQQVPDGRLRSGDLPAEGTTA